MPMMRSTFMLLVLVVLSMVAVATTPTNVAAQDGTMVQVTENSTLGPILTDSEGMTLYRFTQDEPGSTACVDQCAENWPPLTAEGDPMAGEGMTGELGTLERPDGTMQVTYNDMPLYYFVQDEAAGDVAGQDVNGVWYAVPPAAPSVSVGDQSIAAGSVTVDEVVVAEPGWIVIHADAEGAPGPILGQSQLEWGSNSDIAVSIDASGATETLYAMLHSDRGTQGTFEFPDGADIPVSVGGQVVTPPFTVTEGLPQTDEGTTEEAPEGTTEEAPEDTTEEAPEDTTEEAPDTSVDAPTTLPETGNQTNEPLLITLSVMGLLALLGGAWLLVRRKA